MDGVFDAVILALAGTRRAGLFKDVTMNAIPCDQLMPAAGQGALALQCRSADSATRKILSALNDENTAQCVKTERAVVQALQQALESSGPVLVDVVTDPNVLSMPPKATIEQATGFALAMTKMAFTGEFEDVMDAVMANCRSI